MFCKFCKARNVIPVKVITLTGQSVRTAFHCPNCVEELNAYLEKKKKEKKHGYDRA